jgi:hypothetical protein
MCFLGYLGAVLSLTLTHRKPDKIYGKWSPDTERDLPTDQEFPDYLYEFGNIDVSCMHLHTFLHL